jgi:hypothetical protein
VRAKRIELYSGCHALLFRPFEVADPSEKQASHSNTGVRESNQRSFYVSLSANHLQKKIWPGGDSFMLSYLSKLYS